MTFIFFCLFQVKNQFIEHAFEISSFLFFIVPMTVICVLYILIGVKLRASKLLYGKKVKSSDSQRYIKGQSRVIRMLGWPRNQYQLNQVYRILVPFSCGCYNVLPMLVSFSLVTIAIIIYALKVFRMLFLYSQRIMAVYGKIMNKSFSNDGPFMRIYIVLTYISGILYFLSTCINPFLYNIMSHKFRNASKVREEEKN